MIKTRTQCFHWPTTEEQNGNGKELEAVKRLDNFASLAVILCIQTEICPKRQSEIIFSRLEDIRETKALVFGCHNTISV